MAKIKYPLNEQGFASIVIALILIVVLALLTVGFASLARREQQTALDKQLATQANYAAESGVNDVFHAIADGRLSDSNPNWSTYKNLVSGPSGGTTCLGNNALSDLGITTQNGTINLLDAVSYPCVLVNLTPTSDQRYPAPPNSTWSSVFSVQDASGNPASVGSITVKWSSYDKHNSFRGPSDTSFPPNTTASGAWNDPSSPSPPVLQVSLTPLGNGAGLDSSTLIDNTFSTYLYPSTGTPNTVSYPSVPYSSADTASDGPIVPGDCSTTTNTCSVTIETIPSATWYLIRIVNMPYDYASWSWSPYASGDGTGTALEILHSQAMIDVTGKAKNVLKRLHEAVSINGINNNPGNPNSSTLPPTTVEGQNICKRFNTAPAVPRVNPNGTTADNADPSCVVWQYP
jgi:Tfp pilus assembly protein PilX